MKEAKPDLLIVAWAGTTATAMWRSLIQQGVLDMPGSTVVTGLAERATWPAYGDDGLKIKFFTHYLWKAPKSAVNDWLVTKMRRRGQAPDLFRRTVSSRGKCSFGQSRRRTATTSRR